MSKGLRKGLTSYGDAGFSLFLRKAFIKAAGYSDDALERPIVGITNTYSDYNPCHGNVPALIEASKRGVMLAGGMPMVFPTISIHESFAHPTSMYLRNLMAMDTEEMIRAQPMDAVIVIGGCDKTLPAQIMAAASVDLPTVVIPVGPMVVGHHKGEVLGACTDCRRLWSAHRAGEIDEAEIETVNGRLAPSVGTCMVMGTASTIACMTEAMGLSLPMSATVPAPHAERVRIAEASGRRAAQMAVAGGPRPSELLTPAAFRHWPGPRLWSCGCRHGRRQSAPGTTARAHSPSGTAESAKPVGSSRAGRGRCPPWQALSLAAGCRSRRVSLSGPHSGRRLFDRASCAQGPRGPTCPLYRCRSP